MRPILLLMFFAIPFFLQAQQGTIPAGGEIQSTSGEISYSVGQLSNASMHSPSGSAHEGIQQPYEIVVTHTTDQGDRLGIQVTAFPNPVADQLQLILNQHPPENCLVRCTNISGLTVFVKDVNQMQTALAMHELVPGQYFLSVFASGTLLSSITIIKQ